MKQIHVKSDNDTISRGTVLIVEDEAMSRIFLEHCLAGKYQLLTAEDGLKALQLMRQESVDLVITDLVMPVMDGYELISRMQEEPLFSEIPIIVMTGDSGREENKALQLGARDFIRKPMDHEIVERRVENLVKCRLKVMEAEQANREKNEILAGIPGAIAIYRMKRDGTIETDFVSEGLAKLCGHSDPAEFQTYMKNDAIDNVLEEDKSLIYNACMESIRDKKPISVLYRIYLEGREPLLVRLDANLMPEVLDEESLAVWYGVHTPVSEEAKSIIAEQQRLYELTNRVPGGIGVFEIRGDQMDMIYINDAYYRLMETTREQRKLFCGIHATEVIHPEDRKYVMEKVQDIREGKNQVSVSYRAMKADGNWKWLLITAVVVLRKEDLIRVNITIADFDEVVSVRNQLENGRKMLSAALELADVVTWRYNYEINQITDSGTMGIRYHVPKIIDDAVEWFMENNRVHADSLQDFLDMYKQLRRKGEAEAEIKTREDSADGLIWLHIKYTSTFDRNGNYMDSIGIARDITKQKKREHSYQEQLRLSHLAVQGALSNGSLNLTKNLVTSFESSAPEYDSCAEISSVDKLLASVKENLYDKSELEKFSCVSSAQKMIEAFQSGKNHIEVVCHIGEGNQWTKVNYDMMENPYTGDIEAISSIHDITESIRAELVVKQLLEIDYQSIMVVDIRTGHTLPYKSEGRDENLEEILELQREKADTQGGLEVFIRKYALPGTEDEVLYRNSPEYVQKVLETEPYYETTYVLVQDGKKKQYRIVYKYLENDRYTLLCAVQNISAVYEQNEAHNRKIAEALKAARKANEAKTAFLSRVSHDMRTPLNGILGLTQLMKESVDSTRIQRDLSRLELSGKYLLDLINDVLDVGKIESGNFDLHPAVCDGRNVANNVIRLIQPVLEQKRIEFHVEYNDIPMMPVYVDEARLQQIAMNILGNAAKFTPEGGKIEIICNNISIRDGIITDEFLVKDTGIGMKEEFLPHLFEPFSQEDGARTNPNEGTGLGMTITATIVKLMGGEIEVTSEYGKGTCVRVVLQLPIATDEQIEMWKKELNTHASSYNLEGRRVLLCEDHPLNAEIAKRLLIKVGMEVEHAQNGKIGVEMFADAPAGYYDAVLMDIRMPVMDGLDAARAIRAMDKPNARTIPILAMTANALSEDLENTREAGMNVHLSKPIQPALLYQSLENYISPHDQYMLPRVLVVDDVEASRVILAEALHENYEVFQAAGGAEALQIMERYHGMDAVITDVQMPEMDGMELIRRIRQRDEFKHVVIIANTQYEQPGQEERLLEMGANDFIYKPSNPRVVELRVKNALRM